MSPLISDLPGTPLSVQDFEQKRTLAATQSPNLSYDWDTGEAMGRYLAGLKEGKLLGVHCRKCRRTLIPPRTFCELCFVPIQDWRALEDSGRINTFSLCYVTWDMQYLETPQIPAVIEIDGASKGIGIMHMIGGVDPGQVKIGMKVKAVWKPAKQRQGAITDILHFTAV